MERSEQIGQLAAALAKAQTEITTALMDSEANIPGRDGKQGWAFKYADLQRVDQACRPFLSKNAIAIIQTAENPTQASMVQVRTMLVHASGEWIASTLTMKAGQETPQAIGSAITYARRYGLAAICGVVQDDDGGEAASKPDPRDAARQRAVPPKPPATPPAITKDAVINAVADWFQVNRADTVAPLNAIKKHMGITGQATAQDYPHIMAKVQDLIAKGVTRDTLNDALAPKAPTENDLAV